MNAKMEQQASKDIYSKRKVIVERSLVKSKISAFVASVCGVKKKLPVSFQ
jgi:hypothetical protein